MTTCLSCSNLFIPNPYRPSQKFCSQKCYYSYKGKTKEPLLEVECANCSKMFFPKRKGDWKKTKYCSRECVVKSQTGKTRFFTDEQKKDISAKISLAGKGRKFTEVHKKNIAAGLKGRKAPWVIERNKYHSGERSYNWRGGSSKINAKLRGSKEHDNWVKNVLARDNHTCVQCGSKENPQTDHIKPFSIYPDLRLDINNGQTLCKKCHKTKTMKDWKEILRLR